MHNLDSPLDEVDQLMLNAELRDQLEPFLDESIDLLNVGRLPTAKENEFLASMLAWERAPTLPISQWFQPELQLPHPEQLPSDELHVRLWDAIHQLYSKRIVLEFTDHLSDRELYTVIYRDILPSPEKMIDLPKNYLHWHCLDDTDPELYLRYYATKRERDLWEIENETPAPPPAAPRHPRKMPRRPV